MDNFITVYEISKGFDRSSGIMSIAGIILLIIGIIGMVIQKRSHGNWPKMTGPPIIGVVVGGIIFIVGLLSFLGSITESNRLVSVYKSGKCRVTEGIVQVLHRQPSEGHTRGDIIRIDGQELEIDAFIRTQAYSQTISHGGVLKEGVYARVYHHNGDILRIEIRVSENR
jgi:membrane-bound ClpP family serine protease